MTVKECYEKLGGNYQDVLDRLGSDSLIDRFMKKFLNEGTMNQLREAVAAGNIEESFKSAHTLKGVAGNLGFSNLADSASSLTEQLRPQTEKADESLMKQVEDDYVRIIDAIKEYEAAQA